MDINVNIAFEEMPTDCRLCDTCGEMILSNMFVLYIDVAGERIYKEDSFCASCYELQKED